MFDDDHATAWVDRLRDRVAELQDRKRSSMQGREASLMAYLHLLRYHFALGQIANSASDISSALLKSIKGSNSPGERSLALKALAVTVLTCPSETLFGQLFQPLKGVCEDAEEEDVKADAIRTLAILVLHGGGSNVAYEEILEFMIEIIESDGSTVDAADSGAVVTAALQAWGLVASYADDLMDQSEQSIDVFMEQLDSTDVEVQTSAGSNIALVFEAARDYEEAGEPLNLQYNQHRIMTRMAEIMRESPKSISKRDRRHLRSNFASIVTSLEQGKGPGYSTAGRGGLNPHTGGQRMEGEGDFQEFGYREKIRVHNQVMVIDTWSLQARVETLKILLGGGFAVHFMENPVVNQMLENAEIEYVTNTSARKKQQKGRSPRSTDFF